jgi:HSP20 family protein
LGQVGAAGAVGAPMKTGGEHGGNREKTPSAERTDGNLVRFSRVAPIRHSATPNQQAVRGLPFPRGLSEFEPFEPFERFATAWAGMPPVDLFEKDNEYEITAELPGLDDKTVEVKLSNGTLILSGEKAEEREEKERGYHFSERRYGLFKRSFRMPEGVDADKIEASFEKGVLTVRLPKTLAAQKTEKKIAVKMK